MTECIIDVELSFQNSVPTAPIVVSFEKETELEPIRSLGCSFMRVESSSSGSEVFVITRSPVKNNVQVRRSLSDLFEFNNSEALLAFISDHGLRNILEDAHDYLRMRFRKNEFLLNLVRDCDDPDFAHINLAIVFDAENIQQELRNLSSFREHWWSQVLSSVDGKLTISLGPNEFRFH